VSEKDQRQVASEVVHRCMAQLKEHWQNVTITCMSIDAHGQQTTIEVEWDNDKDED
jgi:hypothetical protein